MKRLAYVVGILSILAILLTNFSTIPVTAASGPPVSPGATVSVNGSKVSSLLSMHVKLKKAQEANAAQGTMKPFGVDSKSNTETTVVNKERVFLHFAQKPTIAQNNELTSLGVTIYPNTWIPPVNNFKTGFVMADMPVDQLDSLSAKSYIVSMDSAEQTLSAQND